MKLTYWISICLSDSECYSIRARTKKEVRAIIDSYGLTWNNETKVWTNSEPYPNTFDVIKKVSVEYKDGFDLMERCSDEDRNGWEHFAAS